MRRALSLLTGCFFALSAWADGPALQEGQSWTFENAPHPDARIVIGKIESLWNEQEIAVSVSVVDLNSERGLMIGGGIAHLPFAADALRPHLITLDNSPRELDPAFDEGYQDWKSAVEHDGAGVYTISPAEVIELVFSIIWERQ